MNLKELFVIFLELIKVFFFRYGRIWNYGRGFNIYSELSCKCEKFNKERKEKTE